MHSKDNPLTISASMIALRIFLSEIVHEFPIYLYLADNSKAEKGDYARFQPSFILLQGRTRTMSSV